MIIGITGTNGAGKGTIVEYLTKNGDFTHFSVREILIEEIKKRNLKINRDSMRLVSNELRKTFGPSYLTDKALKKAILLNKNSIIESIRCVGEITKLKENKDFILLSIDADKKQRYKRIVKRNSETDTLTFDEFKKQEKKEFNNEDPFKQNLFKCIEMSDHKLANNTTIEDLFKQLDKIFK